MEFISGMQAVLILENESIKFTILIAKKEKNIIILIDAECWKLLPYDQEQDRDFHFSHLYSTL